MKAVVFDLGNVLIEWDPRRVVSDAFIAETDFFAWNTELDRGVSFDEVAARWALAHPAHAGEVRVFQERWLETIGAVNHDVVALVDELRVGGVGVFGLTNAHALTLRSPDVTRVFGHLDGVVVSGDVGLVKPDRAIYEHTAERFGLTPTSTWFVDDNAANVAGAADCGWNAILFTNATELGAQLSGAGLIRAGRRNS